LIVEFVLVAVVVVALALDCIVVAFGIAVDFVAVLVPLVHHLAQVSFVVDLAEHTFQQHCNRIVVQQHPASYRNQVVVVHMACIVDMDFVPCIVGSHMEVVVAFAFAYQVEIVVVAVDRIVVVVGRIAVVVVQ